jgi:oxygen-independent coproporphyrinogen-3 oxidase
MTFGLYLHVPWCRHVCPYCDFNVYAAAAPPERPYVAALRTEVAAWATRAPWAGRAVETVYLGGGTPSLFSAAAVGDVLAAVDAAFGIAPGAEVTLEANPGTITAASLGAYAAAGVTRLSLGGQSFHAGLLRTLGRDHGPDDTRAAVAAARTAGFRNVSLDLIYAVPGQTVAQCEGDLAAVIALAPEHVSAYALTYEAGTPMHAWRTSGRVQAIDEDDEAAMALAVDTRLCEAGYRRYEISSWARPGFASRHNARYWEGSEYLGVGAGAHSFAHLPLPGRRWVNARLPDEYVTAVGTNGTAIATEEHLTEAQARAEFCFCGLRQTAGIDVAAFAARFGVALDTAFPHLSRLLDEGLVEHAGGRVRLTARGLTHADGVAATFV